MSHDILIRGGTSSTAAAPPGRRADVAIDDGRIAAIAPDLGATRRR